MLARLRGAEVLLTGVGQDSQSRLPAAERVGLRTANLSQNPLEEHLRRSFGDHAPDVWIESSGSVRALGSALESVRPGGTVAVVGLYAEEMRFSPTDAVRREISLLFSYSCNYADYQRALDLLGSGDLATGPLLSEYPLEDALEAFEAVSQGRAVKAILRCSEG
jgi:threonine dehydrogenase-like Zn-dependent dehydrogenase